MIFHLVTPEHRYTIDGYLRTFGRALHSRVQVLPYTRLLVRRRFADGTDVFTDLERLSPVERTTAAALADRLESAGARVLNHPARVLRRTSCCARSTPPASIASPRTGSRSAARRACRPSCAWRTSTRGA